MTLGQGQVGVLHAQSSKKSCPSLHPPGASPQPPMFPLPTPAWGSCNQGNAPGPGHSNLGPGKGMTWRDESPALGEAGGETEARVSLHLSAGWAPAAPGSWVLTHPRGSPDPKCESTTALPRPGPFLSTAPSRVGSGGRGYPVCSSPASSHHSSEGGPSESCTPRVWGQAAWDTLRSPCPGLPAPLLQDGSLETV